jgi:hypothetical protein
MLATLLSFFPNLALPPLPSIFPVSIMSLFTFVAPSIAKFVSRVKHVTRLCDLVNRMVFGLILTSPLSRLHHIHCSSLDLLTPHVPFICAIADTPPVMHSF